MIDDLPLADIFCMTAKIILKTKTKTRRMFPRFYPKSRPRGWVATSKWREWNRASRLSCFEAHRVASAIPSINMHASLLPV